MKILILYFSGTGNTNWVINQLNKLLIDKHHNLEMISIDSIEHISDVISLLNNYDYIGFANPIYGANIPKIMKGFITELVKEVNRVGTTMPPIIYLNTFGYVNGFGYYNTRKLFKDIPVDIDYYINIRLLNNVPKIDSSKKINRDIIIKIKNKAIHRLKKLVKSLEQGHKVINGIGPHLIIGGLIRRILDKDLNSIYKDFVVKEEICIKCMKCVNSCPTKSIRFIDNAFLYDATCTSCMRCFNICPTNAIKLEKNGEEKNIARYHGLE